MAPGADTDFADRCRELCPGFGVGPSVAARKSELLAGTLDGIPVIAKRLRKPNAVWDWYFAHEVAIYRAFAAAPPPFAPRVIAVADDAIIMERGSPLAKLRRPYAALATAAIDALLATRDAIAGYTFPAPPPLLPKVKAQLEQRLLEDPADPKWIANGLTHCHARGLIDDDTCDAATSALAAHAPIAASHGDLLLRNAVERADGSLVLVDWECAGRHVADWDLALLWTQLAPAGRARIDALVDGPRRHALDALVVFALCRELVFLDAFRTPDDHVGRHRVLADLDAASARLS